MNHILVCTKKDKYIPEMEIHIGDGFSGSFLDAEYRLAGTSGYVYNKPL